MAGLTRIHLHWTAGGYNPSALDLSHYHAVIDGNGKEHAGNRPPEANINTSDGDYVAHTLNANRGAIGIAICAMAGAQESPFNWGLAPIKPIQIAALCSLAARLAIRYDIAVTRKTVLTHAEVQPTLAIPQRGKWDIAVLPGMAKPGDPVAVGDKLRAMILKAMETGP